jgi:hypothetical protein
LNLFTVGIPPEDREWTKLYIARHWAQRLILISSAVDPAVVILPVNRSLVNPVAASSSSSSSFSLIASYIPGFAPNPSTPTTNTPIATTKTPTKPSVPSLTKQEIDRICDRVRTKMKFGFALLANFAMNVNSENRGLALRLLDCETNTNKKIGRYVQFKEFEAARKECEKEKDLEMTAFVASRSRSKRDTVAASPFVAHYRERQDRFRERIGQEMDDRSLHLGRLSVIEACRSWIVMTGEESKALAIKKEFGLSDLGYWMARVKAYVARQDWNRLEKLAREKIRRVGVIVDACLQLGFQENALQFVALMQNDEEKVDALLDCGEFISAIKLVKSSSFQSDRQICMSMIQSKLFLNDRLSRQDKDKILSFL